MKFLRAKLDAVHELVKPGGKYGHIPGLFTLFDMHDTILFTPSTTAPKEVGPHLRDKRGLGRLQFRF